MMTSKFITTHELTGIRVLGGKNGQKRIGKVRRFVFDPCEKRCIGFIVKRPDLLWMFRRKDKFVSIEGYDWVDGRIVIRNTPDATDRAACKALGVDWDSCVLWVGLPVITEDGDALGCVGNVEFNCLTGAVKSFDTDSGATANALLGKRTIPSSYIKGFRRGIGAALEQTGSANLDGNAALGALMVSNGAKNLATEGGAAEKAGQATAVAANKMRVGVEKAKPIASKAAAKTGEVVNKGAYATGRQIAKSKTMFSEFKEEYNKARGSESDGNRNAAAKSAPMKSANKQKPCSKAATPKTSTSKATTPKTTASKKNMFLAFKEEYDKARRED